MTRPVVLVPIDGPEDASLALPVAEALAECQQARLLVMHVTDPRAAASQAARSDPARIGDVPVEGRIGEPAAEILKMAREVGACVIVMCKRTTAGVDQTPGATAMEVLQGAGCPLILVPPRDAARPWALRHVLVPHDGTPTTSAALRPAAELAERAGAELLVAHVSGTGPGPSEPGSIPVWRYVDQPHHAWPAWADEFSKRFAGICPLGHLHVRLHLARGDPGAQVLELARKQSMDLIVLAWRGKWEGRAATLKKVLCEASCPVMALRVSP